VLRRLAWVQYPLTERNATERECSACRLGQVQKETLDGKSMLYGIKEPAPRVLAERLELTAGAREASL
jgi:hypothetical protein